MINLGITKMSSKGQIVIPADMRKDFKAGDKLIVIQVKDQMLLKKASAFDKKLAEDLEFARRTEEAYKSYERGEFKTMSAKDFLKKLKSW
ncbi:MAG TPA: AbrB/MazE/SpoVT family DNA-binding domain-containing protein [Candidatus Nanoarchaeia archaeon]|nr:AbrB/MazE/SpoVT family DNA-binding domain-containing protein [Candidatus Nanoarchaeia archaeon]